MDSVSPDSPQKQCTGSCKRWLPATTEYFHRNGTNSLRPDCKECRGNKVKSYYQQPDVNARTIAYKKEYRQKNAEQIKTHKQVYAARSEVKEHKRNYTRAYRERPYALERKRISSNEYASRPEVKERNRPLDRIRQHNKRARVRPVGSYTPAQIQDLLQRQKHTCYYCSARFEKRDKKDVFHIEHIVPLIKGGSNTIDNIVLACPDCNRHKHTRLPHEWPQGGRLL